MNDENLIPIQSGREARERGRNGGVASGKARRKKKEFRLVLETLLTMKNDDDPDLTNIEGICVSLLKKALAGDVPAATWIRDTAGQKPTEKRENAFTGDGAFTFHWSKVDEDATNFQGSRIKQGASAASVIKDDAQEKEAPPLARIEEAHEGERGYFVPADQEQIRPEKKTSSKMPLSDVFWEP